MCILSVASVVIKEREMRQAESGKEGYTNKVRGTDASFFDIK